MLVYEYTAKDETGSKFSGTYNDIDNVAVLREELAKMGYVLVKARQRKTATKRKKKIKELEVAAFAFEFAGMYSAGLPILKCLETLHEQSENQGLREIIADVKESVETGSSLKNAFGKYSNVFSDFFLGMLEAGESGGKLAEALEMSATYLEKRTDLKRKVKAAFAYPVVVSIMCIMIVSYMVMFVVPVFSKVYTKMNVPLPLPTQLLVAVSVAVRDKWWAILIAVVSAATAFRWLSRKPQIRARWDDFKLKMPILAKLNRMVVVSRFIRTFAMLASVGVSLIRALEVANQVAHNHKVTEITQELQADIDTGNSFSISLKDYDIFPPMIIQLAISGEEVGKLPEMLNKGVDFLDKEIDRLMSSLLVKLEPALTAIMGGLVGSILIAVYLPMYDYMQHLK